MTGLPVSRMALAMFIASRGTATLERAAFAESSAAFVPMAVTAVTADKLVGE